MNKIAAIAVITLSLTFGVVAITGCSNNNVSSSSTAMNTAPISSQNQFATVGDVMKKYTDSYEWEYDDKELIYAASNGNEYIRVYVDMTPEVKTDLDAAFADIEKQKTILEPLVVKEQKIFAIPPQSELDALIGKTGAELAAEGYSFDLISSNESDSVTAGAVKEPFHYMITLEGYVDDSDVPDIAKAIADHKVTSVEIDGLSHSEQE